MTDEQRAELEKLLLEGNVAAHVADRLREFVEKVCEEAWQRGMDQSQMHAGTWPTE